MKKLFELEWNDDLGDEWMSRFHLELYLFSGKHTWEKLVRVKEVKKELNAMFNPSGTLSTIKN